jgi:hypothetical protein
MTLSAMQAINVNRHLIATLTQPVYKIADRELIEINEENKNINSNIVPPWPPCIR